MITQIRLQNWKSFENSTFYIDFLNILIGANASGKSNILDAFAFLRSIADGKSLSDAVQSVRGGEDWIIRSGENKFCITVIIEENNISYTVKINVVKENLTFKYYGCSICEEGYEDKNVDFYSDVTRGIAWSVNVTASAINVMPVIYRNLHDIFILDPQPVKMRNYTKVSRELKSDGSNVAGVLCSLSQDEKIKIEKQLSDYVRPLPERDINKIEAVPVGLNNSDAMLYCYEDWNPAQPVDARGMSDGTLRFAAIVVALLTAKPNSLLLIEEVDNGLHPSRAKELVSMLMDLSQRRKVDIVCTTHNPVLLNEFGNRMIPFVSYITRDESGNSKINLLEKKENLAKLMASGSIGDMMINDKL